MRSPIRRVLALDAGSRCIRMLLAQSEFGRFRLLKEEFIDLQAEGLVSAEEIRVWLGQRLSDWGNPPLAFVLPQHLSNSQLIELPPAPEYDVDRLIQEETLKLSGASDSRIIYDFLHVPNARPDRQQFWVTLCREQDIREKILKLDIGELDICEVIPTANALVAAYTWVAPASQRAIIIHAGAQSTVVVVVIRGHGAFASSFQMGGDFFTRSLARLRNISEEAAEKLKREKDLLNGANASPELRSAVDGWAAELHRQLNDWFHHHRDAGSAASFEFIACGGAFDQPGLMQYLQTKSGFALKPWPKDGESGKDGPSKDFEPCFGAALQSLGYAGRFVSLLPEDYRVNWRKRLGRERIEIGSLFLLMLCTLALAFGSWRQLALVSRKQTFLNKIQATQVAVEANEALSSKLVSEYESLRPLFARQQNTLDTLNSLALLQQSRSNRSFWYVLVADQQSYLNAPRTANKAVAAPATATNTPPPVPMLSSFARPPSNGTNAASGKAGLIAELSVPEDSEAARIVLSQLVRTLKQQPLFSKVDLLSDDLKRNLADARVVVSDRDFVLAMDFAANDFQSSGRPRKAGTAPRAPTKRSPRQTQPAESPEAAASSLP
jgi:hypothetical protein